MIVSGRVTTATRTSDAKPAKPIREGGGVYIYRTRKPSSLFGLMRLPWWSPIAAIVLAGIVLSLLGLSVWFALLGLFITGRHFAYVGETVSFADRHVEHVEGGGRWKRKAQPWSDLDPVCVLRIPMPKWKPLLHAIETVLIVLLLPVYNDQKNKWNPRRITLGSARRMRKRRDRRTVKLNFPNVRAAHFVITILVTSFVWSAL